MLRVVAVVAVAALGGGCLARSLAVDTEAVDVTFELPTETFGCVQGAVGPNLPEVRIRSHIMAAGANDDDELFDLVSCVADDGMVHGATTPLELGAYEISLELWDRFGGRVLGRSPAPALVIRNTPGTAQPLVMSIEPVSAIAP